MDAGIAGMDAGIAGIKVKICGITTLDDALAAVDAGADLLGFNFYDKSPRYIDPAACAAITHTLANRGSQVVCVGVFVNASLSEIEATLTQCGLDLAQLSGDEPPTLLSALGERAIKAFRPQNPASLEVALKIYPQRSVPPAVLIDAYRPGAYGGTGQAADWSLAAGLARRLPTLLAGGLTPENVAGAVRQVHPWGVDVASGVESAPGHKDATKVAAFIRAAQAR
jgi:phosphoribosylanthranilate isomerase